MKTGIMLALVRQRQFPAPPTKNESVASVSNAAAKMKIELMAFASTPIVSMHGDKE
tara:strand:+ start:113 stop:280 length:168 start_codon:yes stop_codon:yes gene_type:complete